MFIIYIYNVYIYNHVYIMCMYMCVAGWSGVCECVCVFALSLVGIGEHWSQSAKSYALIPLALFQESQPNAERGAVYNKSLIA